MRPADSRRARIRFALSLPQSSLHFGDDCLPSLPTAEAQVLVGRRVAAVLGTAAVLALFAPTEVRSQVRGVVADATGRPLPGVLVELWVSDRRVAGQGTDSFGRFYLRGAEGGPRAVYARAIGLRPLRRALAAFDSVLTLVMEPRAVVVEAVTVEADRTACPRRDDPRARALWQRAASRYDVELSAGGLWGSGRRFAAIVPTDSVGLIDTTRLVDMIIAGGESPSDRERPAVYAEHVNGVVWPRFDLWTYPFLESIGAWHFVHRRFGAANRLAFPPAATGDTVIAFCSQRGDRPYVRGTLRLGADTTIASAEWEFVTPEPREEAGGMVLFAPADTSRPSQPLLPVAGLFWRKRLRGVYQEWMEYRQWWGCADSSGDRWCSTKVPLQ